MSQEQAQKQKEAIGRRQFNITPSEKLIEQLNCKYKSKLSAGGALWIFEGHFCYYSNLFGTETKIRLRISEISNIVACGNSSIEIRTKTNEIYKFVAFPSKEIRESVIKFITESANKLKSKSFHSPSAVIPKQPKTSIKRIQSQSVDGTAKPDNVLLHKQQTNTIHPRRVPKKVPPVAIAPSKPKSSAISNPKPELSHTAQKTNLKPVKASNMKTDSEQHMHTMNANHKLNKHHSTSLHPSRLLTHDSYGNLSHAQVPINSHTKSSGIDYNNPPNFRLQSIHSQQSLRLSTPQIHSDSDNDLHDSRRSSNASKTSNKDPGSALDTMDIMNIHEYSDETHGNRARSWSDSDMPHCEDPKVVKYDHRPTKKSNKPAFGSAAWFDNIFTSKTPHAKSKKKKKILDPASASLSSIQTYNKTPDIHRAKTQIHAPLPKLPTLHSNTVVNKAQRAPDGVASVEGNKDNEEALTPAIPAAVLQYIDESYSKTSVHLGRFEALEWKPLYTDTIWTNPATCFHEVWAESFVQSMHDDRGSTDLKIGEWSIDNDDKTPSDQPKTYMRKVEYVSKIRDPPPFIAPLTEVYETQRFRMYGSKCVVVDVAIQTPNIKFGDYFLIINRYILNVDKEDENKTNLDVTIAFKWIKKTWFEKIIVSKAASEAAEGMLLWGRKIHKMFPPKVSQQIQEAEENDNIISPRGRIVDKKVIDYFHTPRKKQNVFVNDYVNPCGEIIIDIVRFVIDPSSWKDLFGSLMEINVTNERHNKLSMKHALMALCVLIVMVILCNIGWMFMWLWTSSSLSNVIREQNEILQKQNDIFKDLLIFLKKNDIKMLGNCAGGINDDC